MSLSLSIDRSLSAATSLALFHGEECVAATCVESAGLRTPCWESSLDGLLASAGAAPADIGRAFVGLGPGSFSGIRSALAFAKGLLLPAVSLSLPDGQECPPVAGVPSCAAMAAGYFRAHPEADHVVVVGDARRDTLWMAEYARNIAETAVSDIRAFPRGEALSRLLARPDIPVVTPDLARLRDVIPGARPYPSDGAEPLAVSIGRLAAAAPAFAVVPPVPLYLHPAVR